MNLQINPKIEQILLQWQTAMAALQAESKEAPFEKTQVTALNEKMGEIDRAQDKKLYANNANSILNYLAENIINEIKNILSNYTTDMYLPYARAFNSIKNFWDKDYKLHLKYLDKYGMPHIENEPLYEKALLLKWLLHHLSLVIVSEKLIPIKAAENAILGIIAKRNLILDQRLQAYATQYHQGKQFTLEDIQSWMDKLISKTDAMDVESLTVTSHVLATTIENPPQRTVNSVAPAEHTAQPVVMTVSDSNNNINTPTLTASAPTSTLKSLNEEAVIKNLMNPEELKKRIDSGIDPLQDPYYKRLLEIINEKQILLGKKRQRCNRLFDQCKDLKNNKPANLEQQTDDMIAKARLKKLTEIRETLLVEAAELMDDISLLKFDAQKFVEIILKSQKAPQPNINVPIEPIKAQDIKPIVSKQPENIEIKSAQPITAPSIEAENRAALISDIVQYMENRGEQEAKQNSKYGSLFAHIGGYSAADKTEACFKLLEFLRNYPSLLKKPVKFSKKDIGALNNSSLGEIIKKHTMHVILPCEVIANIKFAKRDYKQEFIYELWNYVLERNKESVETGNKYQHFYSSKTGIDAHTKTRAADKLISLLKDGTQANFTLEEIEALRTSTLGDIVEKYEQMKLLPVEFVEADKNRVMNKMLGAKKS